MKKLLLSIITLSVLLLGCSSKSNTSNERVDKNLVETPYQLDNGKVVINSLFESDCINVDSSYQEGKDIASLELINQSEEYLQNATITLKMSDGQSYQFNVNDLPANTTMWVFNQDNLSHKDATITSIDYSTKYLESAPLHQDEIQTSVEGYTVTLTNLTDHDISNITVTCHATFDSMIYGGVVYLYNIQDLPVNQSVSFEAVDCFMDSAMVVELAY